MQGTSFHPAPAHPQDLGPGGGRVGGEGCCSCLAYHRMLTHIWLLWKRRLSFMPSSALDQAVLSNFSAHVALAAGASVVEWGGGCLQNDLQHFLDDFFL